MSQFPTSPPPHPTPPHPSIHSFSLSFFLRAAREHSCLEMTTEARSRRAALLTWLTCKAVRFSYEVYFTSFLFLSSEIILDQILLLHTIRRQGSFILKAALNDVWPYWPTLISVWHRSLHAPAKITLLNKWIMNTGCRSRLHIYIIKLVFCKNHK